MIPLLFMLRYWKYTETMLVSGLKENDVNYRGEFSFQVTADTKIEWHHTDIALTELMPGQHVSITFSGGVQESYPAQIQDVSSMDSAG